MEDEKKERIYRYAQLYHSTKTKRECLAEVKKQVGDGSFLDEAEIAWEAIDQWEGSVNPRD